MMLTDCDHEWVVRFPTIFGSGDFHCAKCHAHVSGKKIARFTLAFCKAARELEKQAPVTDPVRFAVATMLVWARENEPIPAPFPPQARDDFEKSG